MMPLPRGMEKRILTRTLAVAVVPLLVLGVVAAVVVGVVGRTHDDRVADVHDSLTASVVGRDLARSAQSVRGELDRFVAERLADATVWAATPTVLDALHTDDAAAADEYLAEAVADSPYFAGAVLTDPAGVVVAGSPTGAFTAGTESSASTDWWAAAWADGLHLSAAVTDATGTSSLLAARVDRPGTGEPLGVLAVELDLGLVRRVAEGFAAETDAQVTIVGPDGHVLVDTAGEVAVGASVDELDLATAAAVAAASTERAGSRVEDGWVHGFSSSTPETGPSWVVAVRQPESLALAPLADIDAAGDEARSTSDQASTWLLVAAAVLAVAVVIALAVTARRLALPLRRLRDTTHAVADRHLPQIIGDIEQADRPDDVAIVPLINATTGDELEDLAGSFNAIQETAVRAAVTGRSSVPAIIAESRPDTDATFVALGRRDRDLLRRQADHLDTLRTHVAASGGPTLGHLERLSVRLQRNTENLLVLADEELPAREGEPVPIRETLVLGATVLDGRERITVPVLDPVVVAVEVAADLSHLLAELLENALAFSRPDTPVEVRGRLEPDGYRITITDHGIGIAAHQLAVANARLRGEAVVRPAASTRLGLHVVGRLSQRHRISVTLRPGDPDGIVAGLVLPLETIDAPPERTDAETRPAPNPPASPPSRPGHDVGAGSTRTPDPLPSPVLASIVAEVAAAVAPDSPARDTAGTADTAGTRGAAGTPDTPTPQWPDVFSPVDDEPVQAPPMIEPRD